jgi:hypothetical protein
MILHALLTFLVFFIFKALMHLKMKRLLMSRLSNSFRWFLNGLD